MIAITWIRKDTKVKKSKERVRTYLYEARSPFTDVLPKLLTVPEALNHAIQETIVFPRIILEPWGRN